EQGFFQSRTGVKPALTSRDRWFACKRLRICPMLFQMRQRWIGRKPSVVPLARKHFNPNRTLWQRGQSLVAVAECLADDRPGGKPGDILLRLVIQTKRQRCLLAKRRQGGQEIQFLRRHLREAIQPKTTETYCRVRSPECGRVRRELFVVRCSGH